MERVRVQLMGGTVEDRRSKGPEGLEWNWGENGHSSGRGNSRGKGKGKGIKG